MAVWTFRARGELPLEDEAWYRAVYLIGRILERHVLVRGLTPALIEDLQTAFPGTRQVGPDTVDLMVGRGAPVRVDILVRTGGE